MTWFKDREVLKPAEVASRLNVSKQTVYNWIGMGLKAGQETVCLRAHNVGTRYRIIGSDINLFLEKTQEKPELN